MVMEPLTPPARGFNESTPPEGQAALGIHFPRPL
jgi:hypothetical protein